MSQDKILAKVNTVGKDLKKLQVSFDKRSGQVDKQFIQADKQFIQIDKRFIQIDKRFDKMDKRFDGVDERIGNIDERLDVVAIKVINIEEKLETFATKKEMNRGFDLILNKIDGFLKFYGIVDNETTALKSGYTRLDDRITVVEQKLGLSS
ncbi:hypothetical protein HOF40_05070 [Candidatus Parcubacteria bacterium]|jgi:hypothetical protein|nr:hypothetical protein [Candidatus Parcubacteria bacterium]MBT3949427.1 hypothetical protein [Candidatus Parcubacteria bacterium]